MKSYIGLIPLQAIVGHAHTLVLFWRLWHAHTNAHLVMLSNNSIHTWLALVTYSVPSTKSTADAHV